MPADPIGRMQREVEAFRRAIAAFRGSSAALDQEGLPDASETILESLFREAPIGMGFLDRKLRYVRINDRLASMNRLPAERHLGRTPREVVPHLAEAIEPLCRYVLETGEAIFDRDLGGVGRVGGPLSGHWLVSYYPVHSEEGDVLGVGIVVLDDTERRRADDALRKSEAQFRAMSDASPVGIFLTDPEGNSVYANSVLLREMGLTAEEALGSGWRRAVHPEDRDRVSREFQAATASGAVYQGIDRYLHQDGTVVWVSVKAAAVHDGERLLGHVGMVEDITEKKALEERLLQAQKMESVGRLAGGIAHDFNNLLTVILSHADLLAAELSSDSSSRNHLQQIQEASRRAAGLTGQLLAFARRQIVEPRIVDLNRLTANLERMLRRLIGEDVNLRTRLAPELGSVRADVGQVEQALINLVVNARDAMPGGGTVTITTADTRLDEPYARSHPEVVPGDYVMLEVRDDGVGMPPEVQAHLFEPFFTTKPQGKGTGLGLATCYGIVRQSGGHVAVESEVDRGTAIRLFFPRVDAEPDRMESRAEIRGASTGTETVLVVEDEPMVRAVAAQALRQRGYRVLVAANGVDALRLLESSEIGIDLLVTDVVMPRMGGKELSDRLQEAHPGLRVLFTSGYTLDSISEYGVLDSGVYFLPKPYLPSTLVQRVREVLDG